MHKVLIVDDESWVVESLKDLVDWNRYGFEVAGQAYNGAAALQAMERLRPSVVFTDIRMPEMSGLELIQRGRGLDFQVQFVVVSGYAEFAYAQKAIAYGAAAYCLKPFDEMELSGVLMKLSKTLSASKPASESSLMYFLEDQSELNVLKLQNELDRAGFGNWREAGIVTIVAVGHGDLPGMTDPSIRLKTGAAKSTYLLGAGEADKLAAAWKDRFPPGLNGIGVSGAVSDLREIKGGIEAADALAHQFFVTGEYGVYDSQPFRQEELNRRMVDLSGAIARKDVAAIQQSFCLIRELFGTRSLSIRHAFQVYNMTVSFLFKLGQTEDTLYSYEQLLSSYRNVLDMLASLESFTARNLGAVEPAAPSVETKNRTFNGILHYVTTHFREELSLQSLSEQFFMNPSYISQLFRKEVGETLTGYIARLRIEYACELLDQDEASIQEIAEKIGYNDYFYFTRLFKKMTGKTPTQYRSERQ
ncbi:response regulator [Paenibacillus sp. R14(2021)]|uniref:response regulator transcription factor n=1 Tax=Paenibacillus sp. R14(2021) TaxID=2859228 RepID=UPI001C61636B|nr:response regulator [Paenibacillus sp. R14(2021)]